MEKDNLEKLMETAARLKHAKARVQDAADQVVKAEQHLTNCKRDEVEVEQQFQVALQSLSYGALAPMAALNDLVDALPLIENGGGLYHRTRGGDVVKVGYNVDPYAREVREALLDCAPRIAKALQQAKALLNKK